MLWSSLANWPPDLHLPPEVRRHGRMTKYLDSSEGDLTAWRFPKVQELAAWDGRQGPRTTAEQDYRRELVEAIEEIDQVLRWMRNQDWPFR